ncbi:amino acid transporter [Fomitiporia mediterranea MF3/22]|uniref:amino acid transporter n=1 Tax=Fomitiporia mediterranea (strain MF3/22) TaxID=694068 RepID=UPI0004407701|nr:amino acid transporter [Fomitiporia mediterranea MF3/22]EJD04784.1 amino acid transporter [Fomitiporia mediterranea MF3/22]
MSDSNANSSNVKDQIADADEQLLADLGYKQEFLRAFTPIEVFGVAFSIIGLLPSIASVLFYAIPNGGPSAMVWGWAVASVFILFVGMSMAELGSAAPTSGGLYFWTHSLASPRWRNFLAWIVGYANTINTVSGVASINWGCAVQVMAAASIGTNQKFVATDVETFGVYCLIMFICAVICCLATNVLARLQTVYVILNILLCLAVIIALPAATPKELMNDAKYALANLTNATTWPAGFTFCLSFLAPLWTIGAFDSSVHISEEASNAAIAVPWAIVSAIFVAGVLGWAINVALAFCMGTDLDSIMNNKIGQPMATIFFNSFGQRGTLALWAFVVIVQFFMGTSMLLASSRQVFAFSRDGALPLSRILYRMNSHTQTPVNTVWFSAILATLLGLLVFAGDQAINAVFSVAVTASYVAYSIPIAARFMFENNFKPGPFNLSFFSLPCAIIAVLWMAFTSLVLLFPTNPAPVNAGDMNYSVVVLGGVMFFSIMYYYFPKYGGVYWFKGPIRTIRDLDSAGRRADMGQFDEAKDVGDSEEKKEGGEKESVKIELTESVT